MTSPALSVPDADAVRSDGGLVHIRAATADDLPALHDMIAGLSEESVYRRFFAVNRRAANEYLDRAVVPPQPRHTTLIAVVGDAIVGLGSYDATDDTTAEFALLVSDTYQHKGVGTLLLESLADVARQAGLTRFTGVVLATNADMLHVVHDLNMRTETTSDQELVRVQIDLNPVPAAMTAMGERERSADAASLRPLLDPRSIAVVGASDRPGSVGEQIMRNLLGCFTGVVYPVNRTRQSMFGARCYATVTDVPEAVDLAVVAVPAAAVPGVMRACGERGVRTVLLITAGFGEAGSDGRTLEADVLGIARHFGIRMVGPNCVGIVNTDPRVRLDATFAALPAVPGSFSLVSQSGAFGIGLLTAAARAGVGIAQFVSIGNKADVSGNDLLLAWEGDPRTHVIGMYLESIGDARRFVRIARRVSRTKPILAVKSGRSSAGQRAGASHTAAAATSDVAMDAMFTAAGVVRVNSIGEMLDAAHVLTQQPMPAGRRVVIIGNSGGPGILAADAAVAAGLDVVDLDERTQQLLRAAVPSAASTQNPIDLGAAVLPEQVRAAVGTIVDRPDVDAVIAVFADVAVTSHEELFGQVAIAATVSSKTVVAASVGGIDSTIAVPGASAALPVFSSAEAATAAVATACRCAALRAQPEAAEAGPDDVDRTEARRIVASAAQDGAGWLDPEQVAALLACYRVPGAQQRLVAGADSVVRAAREIGYPVAVKVVAPGLVHKTDAGAVQLDVRSDDDARAAVRRFDAAFPGEHRVLVQAMSAPGVELIVGAVRDPDVGPMVMVGAGGVLADVLDDRAFRLAPVSAGTAAEIVGALHASRLLDGFRGRPPADREAVVDAVTRIAALAADLPEVAELDVNPLVCGPDGVAAVDARIRVEPVTPTPSQLTRHLRPAAENARKESGDDR